MKIDLFETSATETMGCWAGGSVTVRVIRGYDHIFAADKWKVEWADRVGGHHVRTAPTLSRLRRETPFAFRLRARRRNFSTYPTSN